MKTPVETKWHISADTAAADGGVVAMHGMALRGGSITGHVAVLARQRGVPVLVEPGAFECPENGSALLHGGSLTLIISPSEQTRQKSDLACMEYDAVRLRAEVFLIVLP